MALLPLSKIRKVKGLTDDEIIDINNYLLGAIHTITKVNNHSWFSMKDIMGGVNNNWSNKPLGALYNKNIRAGKVQSQSYKLTGRESGWILKSVIHSDTRTYETRYTRQREYRLI